MTVISNLTTDIHTLKKELKIKEQILKTEKNKNKIPFSQKMNIIWLNTITTVTNPLVKWHDSALQEKLDPTAHAQNKIINKAYNIVEECLEIKEDNTKKRTKYAVRAAKMVDELKRASLASVPAYRELKELVELLRPPKNPEIEQAVKVLANSLDQATEQLKETTCLVQQ